MPKSSFCSRRRTAQGSHSAAAVHQRFGKVGQLFQPAESMPRPAQHANQLSETLQDNAREHQGCERFGPFQLECRVRKKVGRKRKPFLDSTGSNSLRCCPAYAEHTYQDPSTQPNVQRSTLTVTPTCLHHGTLESSQGKGMCSFLYDAILAEYLNIL